MQCLTVHKKNHVFLCKHVVRYEVHINGSEACKMHVYKLSIGLATITDHVINTKIIEVRNWLMITYNLCKIYHTMKTTYTLDIADIPKSSFFHL